MLRARCSDSRGILTVEPNCPAALIKPVVITRQRRGRRETQALFLFYKSFAHEPGGPTQNAIDGLAMAYVNLPQCSPLATSCVQELLRAHHTANAVQLLRRTAYAPRGGNSAVWAQAQLREIEAQQPQEAAAANAKP
jgi:hypothetical protein